MATLEKKGQLQGSASKVMAQKPITTQLCTSYPPMMTKEVQALRKVYGLSQEQFAKKFGISVSTLRKWEQGVSNPSPAVSSLLKLNVLQQQATELESA
jgi:DNA-binding transcriptional regulator YiaG